MDLLNNAFKPKHPALLMSDTELNDIIERHRIEVNKNKNKINALNRQKDEIQSNPNIYIDADILIAEIDINIQLIESQNEKIDDFIDKYIYVYIAKNGHEPTIDDLIQYVEIEINRLEHRIQSVLDESIDPDNKQPLLDILRENLNFEKEIQKILINTHEKLQNKWDPDHGDTFGGGRRFKRKSSKRKSSTRRKTIKRKSSKKTRK
jgi:glycosyltransferase involved in cell wall biosynthesis